MAAGGSLNSQDILSILFSHRWKLALPIFVLSIATIIVSITLPPVYRSEATILIESPKIPQDLIRSTVNTVTNERIEYITQRVLTGPRVLSVIDKYNLYDSEDLSTAQAIAEFRSNVELQQVSASVGRRQTTTISFSVSFKDSDPQTAQDVANELITMFLDENLKSRSEIAEQTTSFLADEAEKIRLTITELEQSIAEFKQENSARMPDVANMNLQLMQRYETQHQKAFLDMQEEEAALALLLRQQSQYQSVSAGAPSGLLELKKQYNDFLLRNTDQHPDALRMQRLIEDMQQQQVARQNAATTIPKSQVVPDVDPELLKDPGFANLAAAIETSRRKLRFHQDSRRRIGQQLSELEARIIEAPVVEQEYVDLQRDLANLEEKYQEIRNKELEAQISQNLEQDQKGERFRLLEGAALPTSPESPNRMLLLIGGLAVSIGVGFALVIAAEFLKPGIRADSTFAEILNAPALLTIPVFDNDLQAQPFRGKQFANPAFLLVVASCLLIVGMAIIHIFVAPLETLLAAESELRL